MSFLCLRFALAFWFFSFSNAGEMPAINVQYEPPAERVSGFGARSKFTERASQLAASIGLADLRISEFSDLVGHATRAADPLQMPASFLSSKLQPVDASRLRKSLAATEPMGSSAPAVVNVIVAEDVGGMLGKARYKGMLDQIARLEEDFDSDMSKLRSGA